MLWPFLLAVQTSERGSINSSANCNAAASHALTSHVAWYIFNSVGVAMYNKQQPKITRRAFVVFKSFLFHYYTSLSFYLHSYLM